MIGIVDYGMGNLGSVKNACDFLGLPSVILAKPEAIASCRGLILPGVGAFRDCMRHLEEHGFADPLRAWIAADKPFLGICLGFQALFESSEESPGVPGLGVYPGVVRRFRIDPSLKVPQMGWNSVRVTQPDHPYWADVRDGSYFYFVHSYYVDTPEESLVAGRTEYGLTYTSAIGRGRALAVQFHPEKSQQAGLRLLRNFGRAVEEAT